MFVVAEMAHPRLRERMHDLKLGAGPYYTFYRPYHLTSLEVPLSCARAVLYGTPDMVPLAPPSRRGLRGGEEGSGARRQARCDRRIHLPRLGHDLWRGAEGARRPLRPAARRAR